MLLWLLIISAGSFAATWIYIVHALSPKTVLFLARRQWIFLFIHLPVMWILSSIIGEGLVIGMGSLIGGLVGQGYLANLGRKQGLTWTGRRTVKYYQLHPRKRRKGLHQSTTVSSDRGQKQHRRIS